MSNPSDVAVVPHANSFLYCLLGSAPSVAADILRANPTKRADLHRAIYESRPQGETYDAMMARLLPNGLPMSSPIAAPAVAVGATLRHQDGRTGVFVCTEKDGRYRVQSLKGKGFWVFHPDDCEQVAPSAATDDLVDRFAAALKAKLREAEAKHGHTDDWTRDDWRDALRDQLQEHVLKGDPRDVAAYCAFAWHHSWSLAPDAEEPEACPVCAVIFQPADPCLTDVDLGTCHAACLEGSPIVDLASREPISDASIEPQPYRYDSLAQPKPGLAITLVASAVQGALAIRKWENHGLSDGEHRLYLAKPAPVGPAHGDLWWNPDNEETGFTHWADAFEDAADAVDDRQPIRLQRANRLPDVWGVRIDLDTNGDGVADDSELRVFATEAEAFAALKPEAKP